MNNIDPMTGEVLPSREEEIKTRLGVRVTERWKAANISTGHSRDVVSEEGFVICEHAGEDAEFIAHAPADINYLLGRLDAIQEFVKAKKKKAIEARSDAKYEYSRGRIMDGMAYENYADRLDYQVAEWEKVING
jgi:hypothetical protein